MEKLKEQTCAELFHICRLNREEKLPVKKETQTKNNISSTVNKNDQKPWSVLKMCIGSDATNYFITKKSPGHAGRSHLSKIIICNYREVL